MATETKVQELVHKLEEGKWVPWVKLAVLLSAIAFLINLWFFRDAGFKGLSHPMGMEQAQISREIARGNGFSTKVIRPAAIWQFEQNKGSFPIERTPDTFHAPLNPWLNSFVLRLTKSTWVMTTKDLVYANDKFIAALSLAFFLGAVLAFYFVGKRLFDHRLALLAVAMMLMCEMFWDFALSGLPQMLMLFIFSLTSLFMVRAIEARQAGKKAIFWMAAVGLGFGLLALAHALTIWMFAGSLFFSLFFFRPIGREAAIMAAAFLVCYSPWLVRNYKVCGSPVGLGWYSGLFQIRGAESQVMRSMEMPLKGVSPSVFRSKVQGQTLNQFAHIYEFLGSALLAPVFFIALLHIFKNPVASTMRWWIFSTWLFALFGMSVFGFSEEVGLKANNLHILFVPLMIFYGLALILVMWSRLEINYRLVRLGFLTLLCVLSGLPFIHQFLMLIGGPMLPWHWPPYIPPYIAILNTWTKEEEIISSDMPWGVAWYADRRSLWIPNSLKDFLMLNDTDRLKGQIVGLYLTPVSGNRPFISEIGKGEYKEWAPFIMRRVDVRDFPLKVSTALPKDNECVIYMDRDRWTTRED